MFSYLSGVKYTEVMDISRKCVGVDVVGIICLWIGLEEF